jgi:hypothetical protein
MKLTYIFLALIMMVGLVGASTEGTYRWYFADVEKAALDSYGNLNITGNIIAGNICYSNGSRCNNNFTDLYVNGNTIAVGNITAYNFTGAYGQFNSNLLVSGNITTTDNITAKNILVTTNITIGNLIQMTAITQPDCDAAAAGIIVRNTTNGLSYCNGTQWFGLAG